MSTTDQIVSLRERLSGIAGELAALVDRRKSYSLAATEGDARAIKSIGDCDFESEALRKQEQTILSAIESASALEKQREFDAEAAQRRALQAEAHKHAQAIIALNGELDTMLLRLREAFERRATALRHLADTGLVDTNLLLKFSHRTGPTAAAAHAGLNKFLHLEMVPVASLRTLADSNPILAGIGKASRPHPRGNGKTRET